jgi:enamine deaminase RidA (YjgF/YER057c/UK114 family)
MNIRRIGPGAWNSRIAVWNGMAFLSGIVADDKTQDTKGQTEQVLRTIDALLAEAGSDKSRILSATVYLADIGNKDAMNEAWTAWMDKANPPARAAIGVTLTPGTQVEIMMCAAL